MGPALQAANLGLAAHRLLEPRSASGDPGHGQVLHPLHHGPTNQTYVEICRKKAEYLSEERKDWCVKLLEAWERLISTRLPDELWLANTR